jgi:hypothetical protein
MIDPARILAARPMRVLPLTPGPPDGYPSSTPGSIDESMPS